MTAGCESEGTAHELLPVIEDLREVVGELLDADPCPAGDWAFALAVAENPGERTALGAYADFLDEHGPTDKGATLRALSLAPVYAVVLPRGWGESRLDGSPVEFPPAVPDPATSAGRTNPGTRG